MAYGYLLRGRPHMKKAPIKNGSDPFDMSTGLKLPNSKLLESFVATGNVGNIAGGGGTRRKHKKASAVQRVGGG